MGCDYATQTPYYCYWQDIRGIKFQIRSDAVVTARESGNTGCLYRVTRTSADALYHGGVHLRQEPSTSSPGRGVPCRSPTRSGAIHGDGQTWPRATMVGRCSGICATFLFSLCARSLLTKGGNQRLDQITQRLAIPYPCWRKMFSLDNAAMDPFAATCFAVCREIYLV
jgi:hypothetical protein